MARLASVFQPKREKKSRKLSVGEMTPVEDTEDRLKRSTDEAAKSSTAMQGSRSTVRGDKTFFLETLCGSIIQLRSVDLKLHFTEEEITKFLFLEQMSLADPEVAGA